MKDRRPRKLKKQLKRRYGKAVAFRTIVTATMSATAAVQTAMIASRQVSNQVEVTDKALRVVQVAMDCAEAINNLIKSGPQNWREA